jgi:Uma2 family endonuclease
LRQDIDAEHIMGMPAGIRRHWTAADVRALADGQRHWPRYELLGGELLVTPAPTPLHQRVVAQLLILVAPYVGEHSVGETFTSPADLELAAESITQPDLFVVPAGQLPADAPKWADVTRLLLAVEVLSPSTVRQDRVLKRDYYLSNGVDEYWIVDVDARAFEVWKAQRDRPAIVREKLSWRPASATVPFELDVADFFERRCRLPRLFFAIDPRT